jgi:hypothetical protein
MAYRYKGVCLVGAVPSEIERQRHSTGQPPVLDLRANLPFNGMKQIFVPLKRVKG